MEERKIYQASTIGSVSSNAVVEKSDSTLVELQAIQSETFQLLNILEGRLGPVSERMPEEADAKSLSDYTHIAQALDNQYTVNRKIRRLINELKV